MPKKPRARCPEHEAEHRAKQRAWLAARPDHAFYTSAAWRRTRTAARQAAGQQCQDCGAGGPGVLLDVSHLIPKDQRPDLAHELTNVRVRCRSCHLVAQHAARRNAR
jgi:5-methylcytosine-specific restriction endonuclease McrA